MKTQKTNNMKFFILFFSFLLTLNLYCQTVKYTFINKNSRTINSIDTISLFWKIDSTVELKYKNRNYYKFIFDEDSTYSRGLISIDLISKKYYFIKFSEINVDSISKKVQFFCLNSNRKFNLQYFFPMLIDSKIKIRKIDDFYIMNIKNLNKFSISNKLIIKSLVFDDKIFPSVICLSAGIKIFAEAEY
jgi:hypothetical protein